MGQPVTVVQKPSSNPNVVRFETNRTLSGMGHEYYRSLDDIRRDRPVDAIARRLLEQPGVEAVHINGNIITVHLTPGTGADPLREIVEDLFTFYREGVEVVIPEGAGTD
jgi:hypothetical protein